MSTTHEEIQIDLDEVDAAKAKAAGDKKEPKKDPVEVVRTDGTTKVDATDAAKTEEGLERLKKQLEGETAARIAAEHRANESAESEARARGEMQGTQLDLIKNELDHVTQSSKSLKAEYSAALAAQDYDTAADVQERMSNNAARKLMLENGKAALEKAPKPQARVAADPVDEYVGRIPGEYPRSRAWVRAHPDYVRDPSKNRLMIAAHELALAKGLTADTDSYFDSIEKTLDLNMAAPALKSNGDADPMKDAAQPTRKPAPASAPVTRAGTGNGQRPNQVTLSPDEVEMAERTGQTPEEYARNKVALKKEGRLN